MLAHVLVLALGPAAAATGRGEVAPAPAPGPLEPDARLVDWHTWRRLALLGGEFVPPYRPLSEAEIAARLRRAGVAPSAAGGLWHHDTCPECGRPPLHLRVGGRLAVHELGPGDLVAGEAGLRGRGLVLAAEPDLALWSGVVWAGATPRLSGSLDEQRRGIGADLRYDGWPEPTGRPAVGRARGAGDWTLAMPRAAVGARLGRWALSAGRFPASTGPGLDGDGLVLTSQAESLPQVVLRRTAPLRWSGLLGPLAPAHLLLRAAWTSPQTVVYQDAWGTQSRRARPLFSQWLVSWLHTPWWRTTLTHAALAAPREGSSLWADLPQINWPLGGATWREVDRGPVTDRLFSATTELRFRDAPWPLLPRGAGRLWWEYGGEDVLPHKVLHVPQVSAPASLIGLELVDHRWDLAVQYLETRHPRVLWYGNTGFAEGYTHRGVVLGHELGGAVEAWTAVVRWRPGAGAFGPGAGSEFELRGRTAAWRTPRAPAVGARLREVGLIWRRTGGAGGRWALGAGWRREEAGAQRADWWRGFAERRF